MSIFVIVLKLETQASLGKSIRDQWRSTSTDPLDQGRGGSVRRAVKLRWGPSTGFLLGDLQGGFKGSSQRIFLALFPACQVRVARLSEPSAPLPLPPSPLPC